MARRLAGDRDRSRPAQLAASPQTELESDVGPQQLGEVRIASRTLAWANTSVVVPMSFSPS